MCRGRQLGRPSSSLSLARQASSCRRRRRRRCSLARCPDPHLNACPNCPLDSLTYPERKKGKLQIQNKMQKLVLFSSQKNLQNFSDFPSHQIFRRMHEVLNTDENKN